MLVPPFLRSRLSLQAEVSTLSIAQAYHNSVTKEQSFHTLSSHMSEALAFLNGFSKRTPQASFLKTWTLIATHPGHAARTFLRWALRGLGSMENGAGLVSVSTGTKYQIRTNCANQP